MMNTYEITTRISLKSKKFPYCVLNEPSESNGIYLEKKIGGQFSCQKDSAELNTEENKTSGPCSSTSCTSSFEEYIVKRSSIFDLLSRENRSNKRKDRDDDDDDDDDDSDTVRVSQKKRGRGNNAARWNEMFSALCVFNQAYGHFRVSGDDDQQLGKWVAWQRHARKKGRLTQDRIDMLNSIGFPWSCRRRWEDFFQELCQFKRENGHTNVPRRTLPKLCSWVHTQRLNWKRGILSQERFGQLDSIGFRWNSKSMRVAK